MTRKTQAGTGPAGTIARTGKDGPQLIRSKGKRWTEAAEALFIDALAASCNVTHAAAVAGFSKEAIYRRRRTDAAFAALWQAALDQGVARLDMASVRRAIEVLEGRLPDPDAPLPDMTARDAIAILQLHRPSVSGAGNRRGWRGRPRSLEEVRGSILAKLEAIETARRAGKLP